MLRHRWRWALALGAALLSVAIGLTIVLGAWALHPVQSPSSISAADGTCRPDAVGLTTTVSGYQQGLGIEMTMGVSFPNNMSCVSPDVIALLENKAGNALRDVSGSPVIANGSHSCSTNVSAKCHEETMLYWSNWCGLTSDRYQIVAMAFGGRLRTSSWIPSPPPCTNQQVPSLLGGIH